MEKETNPQNVAKKSKKSFLSRALVFLIYLFFIAVFLFSAYRVLDYILEGKRQSDFNQSLINQAVQNIPPIQSKADEELAPSTEILPEESKKPVLLLPDISVDLSAVKARYPGAVGWLYCPDTVLHYPIMQSEDNQYYVDKLPNGASNANGSLFLDCRNDASLSDWNHIIYGHNMINGSMFGILMDYRNPDYYAEHPFMFYYTDAQIYRLEIFAGVHTVSTSIFYRFPTTEAEKEAFLSVAKNHSAFSSDVKVTPEDKVMVLSTCSGKVNEDKRFVVIAKLVSLI